METYTTVKGQIVIPSVIRKKLGIIAGTCIQVDLDEKQKRIILTPITHEFIDSMRGKYRSKRLLKALAIEKTHERDR